MCSIDRIKEYARTSTIFIDAHPQGVPGFVTLINGKAIWCVPAGGGYTWIVAGECVRESTVVSLLADPQ